MLQRKHISTIAALLLLVPAISFGQTMERPKDMEVGDKATFKWVLNNKARNVDYEWTAVTDDEIRGVQRVDGKEHEVSLSRNDLSMLQSMCYSNGQSCTFSPSVKFADFPLKKGKKWKSDFTVTGETFTSSVKSKYKVDKFEKVKTPAGTFDAFRISHKGSFSGKDKAGAKFSGNESGKYWIAVVNGKFFAVKSKYQNSFGEKFTRELISAPSK